MASVWKLLALFAMLFMPLGMSSAPAAAPSHAPSASRPAGHCPDQGSGHGSKDRLADCTMACAAALPAIDAPAGEQLLFVSDTGTTTVVEALKGREPDIATPPPKLA